MEQSCFGLFLRLLRTFAPVSWLVYCYFESLLGFDAVCVFGLAMSLHASATGYWRSFVGSLVIVFFIALALWSIVVVAVCELLALWAVSPIVYCESLLGFDAAYCYWRVAVRTLRLLSVESRLVTLSFGSSPWSSSLGTVFTVSPIVFVRMESIFFHSNHSLDSMLFVASVSSEKVFFGFCINKTYDVCFRHPVSFLDIRRH